MAELNFGLLTPPGSQSIGNAFVQGMDQAAVARAQENQNALAQYTLSKARREDELNTQLLGDLRNATTNDEIYRAYQRAGKGDVASRLRGEGLTQDKTRLEIAGIPGAQAKTKAETDKLQSEARSKDIAEVASLPDAASASAAIDLRLSNKSITQQTADSLREGLTQENFPAWKLSTLIRLSTPVEQLKQSVVTTKDTDRGGFIERQAYNAQGVAVGAPIILPKTPTPGSVPGIAQAATAAAIARDQGVDVPGAAPAPVTPTAAPAQLGTPVTPTTFPRVAPQVQAGRNQDAKALLQQELVTEQTNLTAARQNLASQAAATDPNIRAFYEKQVKLHTNNIVTLNEEIASKTNNLRGAAAPPTAVVNNLSGAQTVTAINAPPAAAAPGAYSSKMLRDMALKGMQPDGKGGQTFVPGGEADPVVKQRVSTAQAVGTQIGKSNAIALEKLPNAISTGKELIRKLDEILGDANVVKGQVMYNKAPAAGFDSAFGPTGIIARAYPSSEAAAFQARVKEILGGAFLEAYETLRGAQGITDIEGKKATEARTRMGFDLSKTEFITAAREYRKTAAEALARSETRLNSLQGSAAPAQTDQAALDWAAANPSDPRAAQIQQRNGVR